MGADEPLAALSHAHPPLFAYFKQRFAQVTNPPIDAIREKVKTDESVYIGDDGNLLSPAAENCRVIELDSPILTAEELERIRGLRHPDFRVRAISAALSQGEEPAKRPRRTVRRLRPRLPRGREHRHPLRPRAGRGTPGHPFAAGGVGAGTAPGAQKEAHRRLRAAGERRTARRSPAGHAHRLWRAGGEPLSGARMRAGAVRKRTHRQSARAGHRRLRPGAVLRRAQSRLEDGRLHPAGLPERAVVRGRGPRRGAGGRLLHQHAPLSGRHGPAPHRRRQPLPSWPRLFRPPRRRGAAQRRPPPPAHRRGRGGTSLQPRGHPHAATGAVERRPRALRPLRGHGGERWPAHHPLAVDLPLRVLQGRAAGGSRAGGEHRAPLQDRSHVLRLHLAGGARVSWRWP